MVYLAVENAADVAKAIIAQDFTILKEDSGRRRKGWSQELRGWLCASEWVLVGMRAGMILHIY